MNTADENSNTAPMEWAAASARMALDRCRLDRDAAASMAGVLNAELIALKTTTAAATAVAEHERLRLATELSYTQWELSCVHALLKQIALSASQVYVTYLYLMLAHGPDTPSDAITVSVHEAEAQLRVLHELLTD